MKLNKIIGKGLPLKGHKFYMLLSTLCFCNCLFGQNQHVTINVKNQPLVKVFESIEAQTDLSIAYNQSKLNITQKTNANFNNKTVANVLDVILKGTGFTYRIENKHVIIVPVEKEIKTNISTAQGHQNIKVKGIVTDAKGEPVIGATVREKGTTNGTITDFDGKFELLIKKGLSIEVSYIGYQSQQLLADANKSLNIILKEDTKTLDEVVVVGYGTQKKVNLTGAVASVDSKVLDSRPIQNLSSGLQGLVPGLTITGTNGAPGLDSGKIKVRGTGTLNSASPYILIDGIESSTISSVDPNDIESISVLKDASSAAIYGSKASNGVILITTKRGKTGKPKVSYSGYVSIQNPTSVIERMSSYDYARLFNEALEAEGSKARFDEVEIQKFKDGSDPLYPNTNWYDYIYQTGVMHRHNINVTGGTENIKYLASVGYLNQEGVIPNAGRNQFNIRTNLDINLSSRLKAQVNMSFIKNKYTDANSTFSGGGSDQIIRQAGQIAPWIVARYEDGTYGTITAGNPVAWLDYGMDVLRNNDNLTSLLKLDYKIFDGLTASVSGSYVNNSQNYKDHRMFIQYNENKASEPSSIKERYTNWNRTNFDALINYDKIFGKHNFKALLGWHTEKYNLKQLEGYRKNIPNNDLSDLNAGDMATQTNSGYSRELAMISWFGRINYDYAGKYLLEANIRSDASSRFAEGNRWGYFPSFSAAWRLSEESFMHSSNSWLSNLKLRASWGLLGNQDALDEYYPAINTYELNAKYPFGGNLNSGFYQNKYRLSTISWEKATTWGIGLDCGLFNNKVTGSIDYYNRTTTGIIMKVNVPEEFALNPYMENIGSMRNNGIEFNIAYNDHAGDLSWGIAANFSYNHNEVLDLGENVEYMDVTGGYFQRNVVGEPFKSYYIYKADGFFNSQEEADAFTEKYGNPFSGGKFKAGDIKYVDVSGDGKLDGDDRILCHGQDPAFTFGLNLNTSWKNFDLSLLFNGAAKVNLLLDGYDSYGNFSGDVGHPATIWLDAWTPDNKDASMPRIWTDTKSPSCTRNAISTFWLQNASYLRLKNLQLGYTLPKKCLSKIGIENVRFYYSAENLFTIDGMKLDNVDPEATSYRLSSYPLLRTHSFGVNVTF